MRAAHRWDLQNAPRADRWLRDLWAGGARRLDQLLHKLRPLSAASVARRDARGFSLGVGTPAGWIHLALPVDDVLRSIAGVLDRARDRAPRYRRSARRRAGRLHADSHDLRAPSPRPDNGAG